jgi:hypothetical protein
MSLYQTHCAVLNVSDLDTAKQIVKAPKPASGVVKRAMMERTVTRNINAEIAKVITWLLKKNVQFG